MIQFTKQEFLDLLKTVYPPDFVENYGQGNSLFDVYAEIFAQAIGKIITAMAEGLFLTAQGAALDLLVHGERGFFRSGGQGDGALSVQARAFPDTMTPQAMLDKSNEQLVARGHPSDAEYFDHQSFPGLATDSVDTYLDPISGQTVPLSATDAGTRLWSGGAYFIVLVPLYILSVTFGMVTDTVDAVLDLILGVEPMPLAATDFAVAVQGSLTGIPTDGAQMIPDLGLYNAIWNAIDRARPAGFGFDLIVGSI